MNTSDRPAVRPLQAIYELSALGAAELRRSRTHLSAVELELLVLLDGMLTLGKVRAALPQRTDAEFEKGWRKIVALGLVEPAKPDQTMLEFDRQLATLGWSAQPGEGSASLRRARFQVGFARERGMTPVREPGKPLSVIVVEDEPALARFIQSYLSFDGLTARLAANRAEVLVEFRKPPVPDLVLLDVTLPDADGFDILASIRRHPLLESVPVIMLTGCATREAVLKAMQGGADGYVTKPFEADALMRAVHAVLGHPAEPTRASADPWVNRDADDAGSGRPHTRAKTSLAGYT